MRHNRSCRVRILGSACGPGEGPEFVNLGGHHGSATTGEMPILIWSLGPKLSGDAR